MCTLQIKPLSIQVLKQFFIYLISSAILFYPFVYSASVSFTVQRHLSNCWNFFPKKTKSSVFVLCDFEVTKKIKSKASFCYFKT